MAHYNLHGLRSLTLLAKWPVILHLAFRRFRQLTKRFKRFHLVVNMHTEL
jgi:hypothetical protein